MSRLTQFRSHERLRGLSRRKVKQSAHCGNFALPESSAISNQKRQLRKFIRDCLTKQTEAARQRKSASIRDQLKSDSTFRASKTILFYMPLHEEVDTVPLMKKALKEGRSAVLPFIDRRNLNIRAARIYDADTDLVTGSYSIREPKRSLRVPFNLSQIDLALVPGLAFDARGFRLGRGKGYYDRFLHCLPARAKRYGLAFDVQMVISVPTAPHDEPVDRVIVNQ